MGVLLFLGMPATLYLNVDFARTSVLITSANVLLTLQYSLDASPFIFSIIFFFLQFQLKNIPKINPEWDYSVS